MVALTTGHVGLTVSDLDRSVAFYTDVLGLNVQLADQRYAFLHDDERIVLTLWEQGTEDFSAVTAGLHHLSFEVDTIDHVHALEQRLRERGVRVFHDGAVAHYEGSTSGGVFFADPDGVRLEVYAPNGADGLPAPTGEAPTCGFF